VFRDQRKNSQAKANPGLGLVLEGIRTVGADPVGKSSNAVLSA
jgi:hypothetical protein